MHISGMMHVNVNCRDYERSRQFYELLGFTVMWEVPERNTPEVAAAVGMPPYHVRGALLLPDRSNEPVQPVAPCEVASIGPEAPAGPAYGLFHIRSRGLQRGRNPDDVRARLGESYGNGPADAAPATGHQRSPALKIEQITHCGAVLCRGWRRGRH